MWLFAGAYSNDLKTPSPGHVRVYAKVGDMWTRLDDLVASDGEPDDRFGVHLDSDGDTLIVGATGDDDHGLDSGAAYVFRLVNGEWQETQKLLPSSGLAEAGFGSCISLRGNDVIIGAPGPQTSPTFPGRAFVFTRSGDTWIEQAIIGGSAAQAGLLFGACVGISGDAAIVAACQDSTLGEWSGAAYVYRRTNGEWTEEAQLLDSLGLAHSLFGSNVDIDGDVAVVAGGRAVAPTMIRTYIYRYNGTTWVEEDQLPASKPGTGGIYTTTKWLHVRGDWIVAGAPSEGLMGANRGAVFIYSFDGNAWSTVARLFGPMSEVSEWLGIWTDLDGQTLACMDADFVGNFAHGIVRAYDLSGLMDCNGTSVRDVCDIAAGTTPDVNANGIPDKCEAPVCQADTNGSDFVDIDDLLEVINSWGWTGVPGSIAADVAPEGAGDGVVNIDDLLAVINAWGPCP
jgi:hypothetical protein